MTESTSIEKWAETPALLVQQMRDTGDLHEVCRFIDFIVEVRSTLDKTLDVVLPAAEDVYYDNTPKEYKGLTFEQFLNRTTKLDDTTIQRHIRVGRMLEVAPEEVKPTIENMNFKSQIQIANLLEDGVELKKEDWNRFADAYYPQEVTLVKHDIEGTQPRNQFCKFEVEGDQIIAVTSIGRLAIAQFLDYDNPETEEKVEWARGKMLRKLDILQRRRE
jgi:hypothetical protein